jgi:hypothetical protein
MKTIGTLIMLLATASSAFAGFEPTVPEIDANMAGSALALISGGLLVLRSRRSK